MARSITPWLSIISFLLIIPWVATVSDRIDERKAYKAGDTVPVTCLNRTIDTGEHIRDSSGQLQYIPFPVCAESEEPLSLIYGSLAAQNCTITLTDPLFHLLEFYIHNDVPLTCRVPSFLTTATTPAMISGEDKTGALGSESTAYTPLVITLSGTLQLSHLHVANKLNLLIHTEPKSLKKGGFSAGELGPQIGDIISAAAYSTYPTTQQTKVVIGDSLTLQLFPRWYTGIVLPTTSSSSHHNFWSTLSYCALSALMSAAICVVYFRGVDLPRRLRFHGRDKIGGFHRHDGLPKYSGYGYGVGGNGYALAGGKRD